jgi:hypothetical protein
LRLGLGGRLSRATQESWRLDGWFIARKLSQKVMFGFANILALLSSKTTRQLQSHASGAMCSVHANEGNSAILPCNRQARRRTDGLRAQVWTAGWKSNAQKNRIDV